MKTPSPTSRERSTLIVALNPSAVNGTTINFSLFIGAVRPPGQDSSNQARVSLTPVIRMGVLLGHLPVGKEVLAIWACQLVPSGLSLRDTDVSLDMRLLAVSDETTGSDRSEPMAAGLSDPLA